MLRVCNDVPAFFMLDAISIKDLVNCSPYICEYFPSAQDLLHPFEFIDVHVKTNVSPFNGITFVCILINRVAIRCNTCLQGSNRIV